MKRIHIAAVAFSMLVAASTIAAAGDMWNETPDLAMPSRSSLKSEPQRLSNHRPKPDMWAETPVLRRTSDYETEKPDAWTVGYAAADREMYAETPDLNTVPDSP